MNTLRSVGSSPFFVQLADADEELIYGGKAASLARLVKAGFDVPPGFVFVASTRQEPGFPSGLRGQLEMLGSATVIVRSSAVGEDGDEASFAGILESVTVLAEVDAVIEAIECCAAAIRSERCMIYEQQRGVKLQGLALIVQAKVQPRCAGVMFSHSPVSFVNERANELLYSEYASGDGLQVVEGRVDPTRFFAKRSDGEILAGVTEDLPLISGQKLVRKTREIEELFGKPVDIEWVLHDESGLQFVQARPITAEFDSPSLKGGRELWSNANICENYPDPASPMLASIAKRAYDSYFRNLALRFGMKPKRVKRAEPDLQRIVGQHSGYLYYNLSSIRSLCTQLPFGRAVIKSFDRFMSVPEELPEEIPVDEPGFFEAVRMGFGIAWALVRATASTNRFKERVSSAVVEMAESGLGGSPQQIASGLKRFERVRFQQWSDAAIADTAAMFSTSLLRVILKRWLEPERVDAVHRGLLSGIRGLASSEPALALAELAREASRDDELKSALLANEAIDLRWPSFVEKIQNYQRDWGHRCSGELTLVAPNFQENQKGVLDLLRSFLQGRPRWPDAAIEAQAEERASLEAEIRQELGWPSFLVIRAIRAWCHSALRLRERSRGEQARLYASLRSLLLTAGEGLQKRGEIDRGEDVFHFKITELSEFLVRDSTQQSLRSRLRVRRETWVLEDGPRPPDHFILERGKSWESGHSVDSTVSEFSDGLVGLGASPGKVSARAAVVKSMAEAGIIERGDILVAPQTDPGWVPLFPLIDGLVVERGGLLSHGAIVAREFGIPAVVGVSGVIAKISTGQTIHINGQKGTVDVD